MKIQNLNNSEESTIILDAETEFEKSYILDMYLKCSEAGAMVSTTVHEDRIVIQMVHVNKR